MGNPSPSEQIRQLTDPELVFHEYKELMESCMHDIQSVEDAYNHGESPAMGGILAGYLSKYSQDTETYLKRLPVFLAVLETAFSELVARNNRRLIDLMKSMDSAARK